MEGTKYKICEQQSSSKIFKTEVRSNLYVIQTFDSQIFLKKEPRVNCVIDTWIICGMKALKVLSDTMLQLFSIWWSSGLLGECVDHLDEAIHNRMIRTIKWAIWQIETHKRRKVISEWHKQDIFKTKTKTKQKTYMKTSRLF